MSVSCMGFALEDDLEMKEGMVVQLKDDSIESRNNLMIENVGVNGFDVESEFDFWPLQHPTEPSHEDRPVQCPMPHSSHLINDERMLDDQFSNHKNLEPKMILHKGNKAVEGTKPAIRMVRKRHHDHTNAIIPLLPLSPRHPYSHQKTVFNKHQQIPKFET